MSNIKVSQNTANAGKGSLVHQLAAIVTAGRGAGRTGLLTSPAIAIKAGASALAKTVTNPYHAMIDGAIISKAAGDLPAFAGTVTADEFGLYVWTIDAAGTVAQLTLATATTLAGIAFPTVAAGYAVVGAAIINPTGTGNFVGGTTALDDATVVPNAVYLNGNAFAGMNAGGYGIEFRESGVPAVVTDQIVAE